MSHHDHDDDHPHDHDLGFHHDLPRMIGRRGVMSLLGGAGLTALANPAAALESIAIPWETAGPYPADGSNSRDGQTVNALVQDGVLRQDLRASFAGMTGDADGVQLDLTLTLVGADGCTPLANHAIYLWHCDAIGEYSLYDAPGANWLRGVGIADADGVVRFTTIVPGCYDGRWPHMHFEVFTSVEAAATGEASVLTAQIALPEAECAEVYETIAAYSNGTRNLGRISIASDNVFADNSEEEIAQQMLVMAGTPQTGYTGEVTIPIDFEAERTAGMLPPPGGFGGQPPTD